MLSEGGRIRVKGGLGCSFGKGGSGDTGSLFRNRIDGARMQAHGESLLEKLDLKRAGQYAPIVVNSPTVSLLMHPRVTICVLSLPIDEPLYEVKRGARKCRLGYYDDPGENPVYGDVRVGYTFPTKRGEHG